MQTYGQWPNHKNSVNWRIPCRPASCKTMQHNWISVTEKENHTRPNVALQTYNSQAFSFCYMKMSFDVASKVSRKLLDNFLSKFPEIFKLKTLLILMEIPSPGSHRYFWHRQVGYYGLNCAHSFWLLFSGFLKQFFNSWMPFLMPAVTYHSLGLFLSLSAWSPEWESIAALYISPLH